MKRTLKTTTAILASVNLVVPLPALAQSAAADEARARAVEACSLDSQSEECTAATEEAVAQGVPQADIEAEASAQGSSSAEAAAPETAPAPQSAETAGEAAADASAEAGTETGADVSADAEAADGAAADANTEAAGNADVEAGASADADVPSTQDLEESLGAAEDAVSDTAEQASDTAQDTVDQATDTAQDAVNDATDTAEQTADTATDTAESATDMATETGEQATETGGEAEADVEAGADAEAPAVEAEADTEADAGTETPSTEELEQSLAGEADNADEAGSDAVDQAAEATDDTVTDIAEETTAETSTAPDAEAEAGTADADATANAETGATAPTDAEEAAVAGEAPTAAAGAEDAQAVDTTTETVTEETARSSSEDFDSNINRDAEAQANVSADEADDDGLSDLEKALLVGAGALAVGALINNRRVVASANDRVVVSGSDGGYQLIKDDDALLRRPGAQVQTETFDDGSTRTTINYEDGSRVVTVRDPQLQVVRRVRITPNGDRIVLIDDLDRSYEPVDVSQLQPTEQSSRTVDLNDEAALRQALSADRSFDRAYSLSQVRNISEVRQQVPAVDLEAITFDTGSAAIRPEQADELRSLGAFIRDRIDQNPNEIFLVEGHTDAVGDAAYNLALSDRRAESVALALTEYFDVPPSNLVVQGYGERFLKVATQDSERANRRATVRDITPLLQVATAN